MAFDFMKKCFSFLTLQISTFSFFLHYFYIREVIDVNQDKLGKMGRRVSQVSISK